MSVTNLQRSGVAVCITLGGGTVHNDYVADGGVPLMPGMYR